MANSPPRFQRVALVGRPDSKAVAATISEIARFLTERSHEVLVDLQTGTDPALEAYKAVPRTDMGDQADLAIAIGGDGTMLGLARNLVGKSIPLVGINHGRLGFITDIPLDSWQEALESILNGDYTAESRSMLSARAMRDGKEIWADIAMNDVVVNRSSRSGMIELEVHVDDSYMYTQRADGLIISTPTGSTAYALSASGPILHPRLNGIVLVPIAPHSLSNRPICLPDDVEVRIRVVDCPEPRVSCDMQTFGDLQPGDTIELNRAPYTVQFLHPADYSYYATLRSKLYWHELPANSRRARRSDD
jgi:NAD+ kinase